MDISKVAVSKLFYNLLTGAFLRQKCVCRQCNRITPAQIAKQVKRSAR